MRQEQGCSVSLLTNTGFRLSLRDSAVEAVEGAQELEIKELPSQALENRFDIVVSVADQQEVDSDRV